MTITPTDRTDRVKIAGFGSYHDAERAVDQLSDQRFPGRRLVIVGGLR